MKRYSFQTFKTRWLDQTIFSSLSQVPKKLCHQEKLVLWSQLQETRICQWSWCAYHQLLISETTPRANYIQGDSISKEFNMFMLIISMSLLTGSKMKYQFTILTLINSRRVHHLRTSFLGPQLRKAWAGKLWQYLISIWSLTGWKYFRYVHTADALRLLLIERFGGFYADSDFVILKSLKRLKNVIASDQARYEHTNLKSS